MKNLILLIILLSAQIGQAFAFTDDEAKTVILGAAADEGYKEMFAIACALRNRQDLDGIPEKQADISSVPDDIKNIAEKAWKDSAIKESVVKKANAWVNQEVDGQYIRINYKPNWALKKYKRVKIGRHIFYEVDRKLFPNV